MPSKVRQNKQRVVALLWRGRERASEKQCRLAKLLRLQLIIVIFTTLQQQTIPGRPRWPLLLVCFSSFLNAHTNWRATQQLSFPFSHSVCLSLWMARLTFVAFCNKLVTIEQTSENLMSGAWLNTVCCLCFNLLPLISTNQQRLLSMSLNLKDFRVIGSNSH